MNFIKIVLMPLIATKSLVVPKPSPILRSMFAMFMLFGMLSLIHPVDAFAQTTITRTVAAESDDAEEEGVGGSSPGAVYLDSSDLELVRDNGSTQGTQQVGIRFTNITVPVGATITNAYISFVADVF